MKREDLKNLLASGKEQDDIINEIMSTNGKDIETAKASVQVDLSNYVEKTKFDELTTQHNELVSKHDSLVNEYGTYKESTKDYEDIKGKYGSLLQAQENTKKLDYLKGLNCKHPDLLVDKMDWSKVDFDKNEIDKDYFNEIKGKYEGLFAVKEQPYTPPKQSGLGGNYNPKTQKEWTNEELRKL